MKSRVKDPAFVAYMNEVNKYPMMDRAEEFKTAKEYEKTKSPAAAEKMIRSNLRFVAKIVYKYSSSGHEMMDLIQEGNEGLLVALRKFEPDKGYKFITYAVWWIQAFLKRYMIKNQSSVKIGTTNAQRNLYFSLRKEKAKMMALTGEINYSDLAELLGFTEEEIRETDARMAYKDYSLQSAKYDDNDEVTFQDMLESPEPNQEDLADRQSWKEKMDGIVKKLSLNGKEWAILEKRLKSLDPLTLQELGNEFGVTRERVRQIEAKLKDKLRREIKKEEHSDDADSRTSVDTIS